MKKLILTLTALLISGVGYAAPPALTHVPVDHIFAPTGFHDHENTQVVVTGFLPNLCHKSPKADVIVEGREVRIDLQAFHYHATNEFCAPVLVPFVETVDVGLLDRGEYNVKVNSNTQYERRSMVQVDEYASSAISDYVFANVHSVSKSGHGREVLLQGYNPSDCFELKEVKYDHNKNDTYSVYPVLKQVSDFCPKKMVPFTYEFEVPQDLDRHQVLLHVKGMDGRSVNAIFNNIATH